MKETELFVKILKDFKQNVETVSAKYAGEFERLERYRDSASYEHDRAFYEKQMEDALTNVRNDASQSIVSVFSMMRHNYSRKPLALPTDEEKAVLDTLSMLDTLTKDDVLSALNTCTSPLALRRLQELAKKSNINGVSFSEAMRRDDISRYLQSAENGAEHFIRLYDGGKNRSRYVHDPIRGTDSIMLSGTREGLFDGPASEVWHVFGNVPSEKYAEFSETTS